MQKKQTKPAETAVKTTETKAIAEVSASERFTKLVMQNYQNLPGSHQFTEREKALIRGYFIVIDEALKDAEAKRKQDNPLPYNWNTVDLNQLAIDLAHYARIGLDMLEDNHLFPIPYKDNKNNRYTVTLMEGYNGIRYQAEKYAVTPPKNVIVELVFSTDKFQPIKKGKDQPCDTYLFEITNPFDRGAIVGAFGYIEYEDQSKNTLVVMSKADMLKRKPKYASAEFWGSWEKEMYEKTMKREIYKAKHIPRDPMKIDESYQFIRHRESQYAMLVAENEVQENANTVPLTVEYAFVDEPEALPEPEENYEAVNEPKPQEAVQTAFGAEPDFN